MVEHSLLVKRVLQLARQEAERCGHPVVDTGHVLLALVKAPGYTAAFLKAHGIDLRAARDEIIRAGHEIRRAGETPPSEKVAFQWGQHHPAPAAWTADGATPLDLHAETVPPRTVAECVLSPAAVVALTDGYGRTDGESAPHIVE